MEPWVTEVDTDFMKERIKQHPVNKKKLLMRTLTTGFFAVLFGAIACIVFLYLEPLISRQLNPPKEEPFITFPEETVEEMSPEDMIADDKEIQKAETEEAVSQAMSQLDISQLDTKTMEATIRKDVLSQIRSELDTRLESTLETYEAQQRQEPYAAYLEVVEEIKPSLVTVTGITPNYDWAGEAYESTGRTSGLFIADTGERLLILCGNRNIRSADTIRITLPGGGSCDARRAALDSVTGLCVLTVSWEDIPEEERESIGICTLGSSRRKSLLGHSIIAVGSPSGTAGSVSYGIVTAEGLPIDLADSSYTLMTTDIYGSTQASGVLVDLTGEVVGWIDMSRSRSDSANQICAVGITDLKLLIERMSNTLQLAGIGVHGTDVPESIHEEQDIPYGAYVRKVDMDSPAMEAGIQSGDVIVRYDGEDVENYTELVTAIQKTPAYKGVPVRVMRRGSQGYVALDLNVTGQPRLTFSIEEE